MEEEPRVEPSDRPSYAHVGDEGTRMSEGARATNIFLSPGETFEDINRKPTWIIPILITIVFTIGFGFLFRAKVLTEDAFERMTRERMEQVIEKQGMAQPPPEALEQQMNVFKWLYQLWHVLAVAGLFLTVLIVAGVYFLVLMVLQSEVRFKKVFSVVCWAWMPQAVAEAIVGVITLLLRSPDTIDLANPLATNPGIFLSPKETVPALYAVASSLDIFTIWFLILLSIGFCKISRKISIGRAATVVFVVWALYVLGKAGLAAWQG